VTLDGSCVPQFSRGYRLREDKARGRWVILAPERLFELDDTAVETLRLVDGVRTVDGIIDALAAKFDAPRDVIAADVTAMLAGLRERQVIAA
jgi:pyrroloquinoline quinone biosynthesis protein D